jgi:hypothetical protein
MGLAKYLSQGIGVVVDLMRKQRAGRRAAFSADHARRGLKKLALNAGSGDAVGDVRPLEKLSELTQLSLELDFRDSEGSYVHPLEKLRGLTEPTLHYNDSQMSGLMLLEKMKFLRILSIDGANKGQRMSLHGIPATLTQIEF